MNKIVKTLLLSLTLPMGALGAESAAISNTSDLYNNIILIGLLIVAFLLVIVIFALLRVAKVLFQTPEQKAYEEEFGKQNFWEKLFNLNPISYEQKLLIDHKYDGIQELNNPTPPWFNFLFYSTILFGVLYLLAFHVIGVGKFQDDEYKEEVIVAEKAREEALKKFANSINEDNVVQLADKASLELGNTIYTKNCVACHGAQGQGGVGPNLTDNFWLHGGGIKNIFHTITLGVPQKGMIAWQKQLNPLQIQQVASYVLSLEGTNPPNAKKAEGDLYQPEAKAQQIDSTKTPN